MVNEVIENNQENLNNLKCIYVSVYQGSVKFSRRQLCPHALFSASILLFSVTVTNENISWQQLSKALL